MQPARKLASLIKARKLSATEVMKAFIAQIERVNPKVNAIVTFLPEQALKQARAFDKKPTKLPFAGLPIAIKDVIATKGVRTTWGSLVHKDHVPTEDHIMAERLKAAGAILIGKTNTPEFGAGSQTFNKVFGATRNPYDLSKTCGGSSGGAGVAVATGMLPFADGGDFAASLQEPGQLLQRDRLPPFDRARARLPASLSVEQPERARADGAHRRGRRVPSFRAGGPRPPRSDLHQRAGLDFPQAAQAQLQESARSVEPRSRRLASRKIGHRRVGTAQKNVQGPRLHRRGRRAGLYRRD